MIGVGSVKTLLKSQLSNSQISNSSVHLKLLPHEIKRKKENERITEENKKMLLRL